MFERLGEIGQEIRDVVSWIRRERVAPKDAVSLLQELGRIENTCASARVLLCGRIAETKAWQEKGERSAAHFVARATRTTVARAAESLETAKRLEELPRTAEAFEGGRVSETQVREIASAASLSPSSEQELLHTATTGDVTALREECRRVRSSAITDEVERYEAIHRSRYLRSWSDQDGAFRLDGRLTPDAGATVMAALEPYRRKVFEDARRAGRKDRQEAYLADALLALAQDGSGGLPKGTSGPRAMVHVRVDHAALVRGHRVPGEICEVPGVGPIPVATARALSSDAILAAVLTEGADVKAVAHLGRTIPARLRTALEARDQECVVPGCHNRYRLEIDHVVPLAEGGRTSLDNLARMCRPHHHMKTNLGFCLEGSPGKWRWIPPKERAGTAERGPP
ncbi:MAG TPA: DUF222 domain-containing protein [Actinomycetota bacterium]|nr:DUF222 domain-containing protein [Actinomycetota bacterium]